MSNFSIGGNQPQQPQYQHQQQNAQVPTVNGAPLQQTPTAMPAFNMTPEMQAQLQGVTPEQFAAIAAAFRSGLIPLPPAGLAPSPPSAPITAPTAVPRPLAQPHSSTNASGTHPTNEDVDMGQEDGEIEDGEVDGASTPQVRGFLRTPPKGPASSRRGSHQQMNLAQNGPRPGMTPRASSSTIPKAIVANGKAPVTPSGDTQLSTRPNKEAASKAFVLEMHRAGYTYGDLAREVKDHKMLRRLYFQLGLPVPSSSSVKAPAISQPVASPVNVVRKQVPAPVAKVPEKADRSAYLAKLAAVKGKKTEAAKASATPPAPTQAAQPTEVQPILLKTESPLQTQPVAEPAAATTTPPAAALPAVKAPVLSHDKNLLLRQRLEALRAEQAAKQRAKSSSEATQPSSPAPQQVAQSPRAALGAGLEQVTATGASPSVTQPIAATDVAPPSATASPSVNRSAFSLPGLSLPGLFPTITPPPAQPTSSPPPNANPRFSAPQIPTTAILSRHNGISATQSSLAQRNDGNSAERCVIEVSSGEDDNEDDEDDDGEEMDIDDNSEDEQVRRVDRTPTVPSKATAPLHSLPISAAPSAPGTPNAYDLKMEEAAALRQKIAEMEERSRRKVPASISALPSPPSGGVPGLTARLGNGNSASPSVDNAIRAQSKLAIETFAQNHEGLDSGLNGSKLPKPGHSHVLPSETSLPQQAIDGHPTTANANTMSDIEDDDDDEDLYGEAGNAEDTRNGPSFVDSQATAVSEDPLLDNKEPSVESTSVDHANDDMHQGMDVDRMLEEQLTEAPATAAGYVPSVKPGEHADDDESLEDDDLDNVYDPPPAIEAVPQAQQNDDTPAVDENGEDSDDAMDTSDESSSDSESDEDEDNSPDNLAEPVASSAHSLVSPTVNDMDSVPEQISEQPQHMDIAAALQPAQDSHEDTPGHDIPRSHAYYTPYDSALKRFKDYIYHPDFTNTASTGFKSLTFNHKIDPNKQLCYAELNEGQCADPKCGWQHFRDMNLLDNELLRLIGTVKTPARDPEQKARWNQGLSSLINELRTNPAVGRDAGLIAQRIAEYRRTFVEDPTRVVLFDD